MNDEETDKGFDLEQELAKRIPIFSMPVEETSEEQRKELAFLLTNFRIFSKIALSKSALAEELKYFLYSMKYICLKKYTALYHEGATDPNVYLILKGKLTIFKKKSPTQIYTEEKKLKASQAQIPVARASKKFMTVKYNGPAIQVVSDRKNKRKNTENLKNILILPHMQKELGKTLVNIEINPAPSKTDVDYIGPVAQMMKNKSRRASFRAEADPPQEIKPNPQDLFRRSGSKLDFESPAMKANLLVNNLRVDMLVPGLQNMISSRRSSIRGDENAKSKINIVVPKSRGELNNPKNYSRAGSKLEIDSNSSKVGASMSKIESSEDSYDFSQESIDVLDSINVDDNGETKDDEWILKQYGAKKYKYFREGICLFQRYGVSKFGETVSENSDVVKNQTVIALEETHLLMFNQEEYNNKFAEILTQIQIKTELFNSIIGNIGTLDERSYFIKHFDRVVFKPKEVVFEENQSVNGIYLIYKGEVTLLKYMPFDPNKSLLLNTSNPIRKKDNYAQIVTLGPGQFLGEELFLDLVTRKYKCVVSNSSQLLAFFLPKTMLRSIKNICPTLTKQLKEYFKMKEEHRDVRFKANKKVNDDLQGFGNQQDENNHRFKKFVLPKNVIKKAENTVKILKSKGSEYGVFKKDIKKVANLLKNQKEVHQSPKKDDSLNISLKTIKEVKPLKIPQKPIHDVSTDNIHVSANMSGRSFYNHRKTIPKLDLNQATNVDKSPANKFTPMSAKSNGKPQYYFSKLQNERNQSSRGSNTFTNLRGDFYLKDESEMDDKLLSALVSYRNLIFSTSSPPQSPKNFQAKSPQNLTSNQSPKNFSSQAEYVLSQRFSMSETNKSFHQGELHYFNGMVSGTQTPNQEFYSNSIVSSPRNHNLIRSKHNLFRFKPKRGVLLERYHAETPLSSLPNRTNSVPQLYYD